MGCRAKDGGSLAADPAMAIRGRGREPRLRDSSGRFSRRLSTIGLRPYGPAMTSEIRTFTVVDDDDGIRLDRWFKRHLPDVSFNLVSRWARTGQLRVDGKRSTPG